MPVRGKTSTACPQGLSTSRAADRRTSRVCNRIHTGSHGVCRTLVAVAVSGACVRSESGVPLRSPGGVPSGSDRRVWSVVNVSSPCIGGPVAPDPVALCSVARPVPRRPPRARSRSRRLRRSSSRARTYRRPGRRPPSRPLARPRPPLLLRRRPGPRPADAYPDPACAPVYAATESDRPQSRRPRRGPASLASLVEGGRTARRPPPRARKFPLAGRAGATFPAGPGRRSGRVRGCPGADRKARTWVGRPEP